MLSDRRLTKARPSFFDGSIEAAIAQYQTAPSADLLIIETHAGADTLIQQLDPLSEACRADTNLILIGTMNDVGLYRALTKAGVREYLPMPLDTHNLLEAVIDVCADPADERQGRLISFIGASGGAGSTTIANNISWCLGKLFDGEVTLVDLDFAFGTVSIDFNLESPENSAQALSQADRLDEQFLARIIGKYNDNLGLLTAPGDCGRPADFDPQAVEEMLKRLRANAAWVATDLPRTWDAGVQRVLGASDEIVVTAVPTLASLRNAKSLTEILNAKRKNDTPVRVVLNHAGEHAKTEISAKDFASTVGSALTVIVPHEPSIFAEAANAGRMVGEAPRAKGVIEPLNTLATLVSGRQGVETRAAPQKSRLLERVLPAAVAKLGARAKA